MMFCRPIKSVQVERGKVGKEQREGRREEGKERGRGKKREGEGKIVAAY